MFLARQYFILCLFAFSSCVQLYSCALGNEPTAASADVIVQRLQAANLQREKALRSYTARRIYEVEYRGIFGRRHAQLVVDALYESPANKKFTVVSQSGSTLLLKRVLLRLLDSEKEAIQNANRARTALTPQNYSFSFLGIEDSPQGMRYVLEVAPKVRNKFVYRGKIWIDCQDFAVVQIEGEPAKNPSWWTRRTQIQHHYAKLGEFWLPVHNESVSQVRLGGKAVLTIEYVDYRITSAAPPNSERSGGGT